MHPGLMRVHIYEGIIFQITFDKNFKEILSSVGYLKIPILKFGTIFVYILRGLSRTLWKVFCKTLYFN